jgi:hypothetical protein
MKVLAGITNEKLAEPVNEREWISEDCSIYSDGSGCPTYITP